jgi:hypothetical protein
MSINETLNWIDTVTKEVHKRISRPRLEIELLTDSQYCYLLEVFDTLMEDNEQAKETKPGSSAHKA